MKLTKTSKPLFVSLLLDETGSMQSIKEDTIRAYNQYLDSLKETEADAPILFSLVTFNSSDTRVRTIADPVKSVNSLTDADYQPNHMTPLIDAAVKIIRATDEAVVARGDEPDVVVVIQTDGQENCSVEFDPAHLAQLVKEKEAAGWQFLFLGAGLDAFDAATYAGFNLAENRVISYGRDKSDKVMGVVANKMSVFYENRSLSAMDIVAEDRAEVGDRWFNPDPGQPSATAPKRPERKSTAADISLMA